MFSTLVAFASLALAVVAAPSSRDGAVRVLYTFTDGAYPENIAVRPNGDILVNSLSNGRVYTLDPTARKPQARVLVELAPQAASGFTGITEYERDKFAVVSGKFNLTDFTTKEAAVWSFDAADCGKGSNATTVKPKKIVDIPVSGLPNGITTLDSSRGILLAADSVLGVVWSIDLHRGVARHIAEDATLKTTTAEGLGYPLGINGVHTTRDGSNLYFTNLNTETLYKVPVHRDGSFAGNVSLVANIHGGADDFIIGKDGRVWVTGMPTFLNVVHRNGKVDVHDVLQNEANPGKGNPTAAAFGRGSKAQEKILYVVTSWGVVYAVDTTRI